MKVNFSGRIYHARRFFSAIAANGFMEKNSGWGVLTEKYSPYLKRNIIYVARNDDKGTLAPEYKKKEDRISCVCMECGIRNDHSTENGYCQNGHDAWLEFKDVEEKNEFFEMALELTGLEENEFITRFMNNRVKQFPLAKPVVFDLYGKRIEITDFEAAIMQCEANVGYSTEAINSDHVVKYAGEEINGKKVTLLDYWKHLLKQIKDLKNVSHNH